jgi:predicted flap endonuclease-1-like 5' DNA nuclease
VEQQLIDTIADPVASGIIADLRRRLDEVLVIADLSAARHAEAAVLRKRLDAVLAARRSEVAALRGRIGELEAMIVTGRTSDVPEPDSAEPAHDPSYADLAALFHRRLAERGAELTRRYEDRAAAQRRALEERDEQIRRLTRRLAAAEQASTEVRSTPSPPDPHDIERVRGIGPVIAATLRSLGITTLQQIASLTETDLDHIDEHLSAFQGRSRRERWIEQAKELTAPL